MKALQIIGSSGIGGVEYLLHRWCRYLVQHGWQVDVLATDPQVAPGLARIPGVRVIDHIVIPRDIRPARQLRAAGELLALLRRERYPVVHTYTATPGFLGRVVARLAGVPVILHHQAGWTVNEFNTPLERAAYTPLEYLATLASTRTICVSHADFANARRFRCAPAFRLATICNGIDPGPYEGFPPAETSAEARAALGVPADHFVVGNLGRLAAQKDNGSLIRAVAALGPTVAGRPLTLLLAGDGQERAELEALAAGLGVAQQVRFLGFRRDTAAILSALDVFASPSLWEGLSIALLEAMCAARPIVTTDIIANAELILDGATGLLVPPRRPDLIARAVARFAEEPGLARSCAAAARRRAREQYGLERMLRETLDLQLSLLPARLRAEAHGLSRGLEA